MIRVLTASLAAMTTLAAAPALAATVHADLTQALPTGAGAAVGSVTISDGPGGAVIALDLKGLPPGPHGMHLHEHASCLPAAGPDGKPVPAGSAGGHWDPQQSGHHMGPQGQGHMGDLPRIEVGPDGTFKGSVTAPRIKEAGAVRGRALMIHAGGDNYSDTPPLGGGGARLACSVLE